MKALLFIGLTLSLTAYAQQSTGYAPNDGTAKPGNPGTFSTPNTGMTDVEEEADAESKAILERSNTSPNPIPTDTTLQGNSKQSQEDAEEEVDYRTHPKVDHTDQNASENQ